MDGAILYLWVDRGPRDFRSIPNPAQKFDGILRETVREICGRAPAAIRYLDRPPKREHLVNERRVPAHRTKIQRRQDLEHQAFLTYAKEECRRLYERLNELQLSGTNDERLRKLTSMVEARAKERLEKEGLPSRAKLRRGPPPSDPPPDERSDR